MDLAQKQAQLTQYVDLIASNGISQHSQIWHDEKQFTIGGSSIASIQGLNPYCDKYQLIRERTGIAPNRNFSNISCQWGNLFEELIKIYFEKIYSCTVLGEDLYIPGQNDEDRPPIVAYSPDGLAIISRNNSPMIVLCEFKCPQSRIPAAGPPKYYVPQVKMGMDLIPMTEIGILVEAVYRRCTWEDLGRSSKYDLTLVPKALKNPSPIAYGIIGLYYAGADVDPFACGISWPMLVCKYMEKYGANGDESNDYLTNDLGDSDVELFKMLMDAYSAGVLVPWYGPTHIVEQTPEDTVVCNDDLAAFMEFCRVGKYGNFGMIPWKLFQCNSHWIEKTPDYLAPWMDEIRSSIKCIRECNQPNADVNGIYQQYMEADCYN